MSVGKSKLERILDEYGTPAYAIDMDILEERYERLKSAFPDNTIVAYAVKSNYTPSVVEKFRDLGTHFDVFSLGELQYLQERGCDPGRVVYTSVAETAEEFESALDRGVRRFVLGSMNGARNFKAALDATGVENAEVMLRIQPIEDVNASTSTSGVESKFGTVLTDERDSVERVVEEIREDLELAGFHFHLGTQVEDPEYYVRAIEETLRLAEEKGLEIETLDIGGGYPAEYSEKVTPLEEYGKKIGETVEKWREKLGEFKLIIEPGRSLVAESTDLIVEVVNVKEMYGRKIVVVNGGENMISLEGRDPLSSIDVVGESRETFEAAIAGNLCHSRDWILEEPREMKKVEIGDPIVFRDMGAYVINKNNSYNLRKIPRIITIEDGELSEEKHPFKLFEVIEGAYERS